MQQSNVDVSRSSTIDVALLHMFYNTSTMECTVPWLN